MNLNESEVRQTMDSAVHKGYMMARQKLATTLSAVIKTNSSSHSVEAEITQILDQLYETWVGKVYILNLTKIVYSQMELMYSLL